MQKRSMLYYGMILLAAGLLLYGILYPCMTIKPPKDKLLDLAGAFDKKFKAEVQELSVAGGVVKLYSHSEWFVATLIGLFSIVFPAVKLCLLLWLVYEKDHTHKPKVLHFIEKVSKYSMLDVMVLAILLLTIKALPGKFEVQLNWGLYAFSISLLLSFAVTYFIHKDIVKAIPPKPESAAPPASGSA